jgi:hypothetical protein
LVNQISGMMTMKITAESQKMSLRPSVAACASSERSKKASA